MNPRQNNHVSRFFFISVKLYFIALTIVALLCYRSTGFSQAIGNVYYQTDQQGQCDFCNTDYMRMDVANGSATGVTPGDYNVTYHRYNVNSAGQIVADYGNGVFGIGVHADQPGTVFTAGNELWGDGPVTISIATEAGGAAVIDYIDVKPADDGFGGSPDVRLAGPTRYRVIRAEPCSASCPNPFDVTQLMPVNLIGAAGAKTKPNDLKEGGDPCAREDDVGMAHYSVHAMLVSLNIEDTPIRYVPQRGPAIRFTVTYNQRETQQPDTFTYSNLGSKWTFNWLSYVIDDPNNSSASASVYVPGGGAEVYSGFDAGSQSYQADPQSHAVLVRTSTTSYEKRFPDGSKHIFNLSDGSTSAPRKIFMTQLVDPAGNGVSISYDASFRVTAITDALGQVTTLSYELPGDPLKITRVSEPFSTGRSAIFAYDSNAQLISITDEIGIQSIFHYTPGTTFIDSLTTPYGTSTFAPGESGTNRWIEMTDPLGGKERVEYRDNALGIAASDPSAPAGMTNSGLDMANTFYWDKKAIEMYPPANGVYDYTKARITHWTFLPNALISGIPASEKMPLENRVWYAYSGQSDTNQIPPSANPSKIARILGDGSIQTSLFEYNVLGHVTKSTDPIGRVMSYVYDSNNIDLLEVRQTTGSANELLRKFIYNTQHEPLTDTGASGKSTTFTYNAYGQIVTRKNAKNETTTFGYGDGSAGHPVGYLTSIISPPFNNTSAVTTFTYDSANRVRTVTDSDNYTVTTDYDNLDRPVKVTYPDATFQQFEYAQDFGQGVTSILDLTRSKDRRGLWTTRHYNGNRQLDSITDPLNRTTRFGWCTCGSLVTLTDPKNQVTTFNRDLQSRVYQKVFADNTAITYLYDGQRAVNTIGASSRLKSSTDAKNQRTNYSYFADDNVQQVSYTNSSGQPLNPATPSVSYTYDPHYNRVATMIDGTGTTTYGYNPIVSPPSLGAGQLASIDGPITNDTITFGYDELDRVVNRSVNGVSSSVVYDALGRPMTSDNPLGHFSRVYDANVTPRIKTLTFPTGQSSNYSYFDNSHDRRLQTLQDLTSSSANVSKFDYTYDAEGQISPTWIKQLSSSPTTTMNLTYDSADELTQVVNTTPNGSSTTFSYGYDPAGNRTSDNMGAYGINDVNEITNTGYAYDANGNLTSDGVNNYQWDAANRMTAIIYSGTAGRSEFTYDGLGRRVQIVEKNSTGIAYDNRRFIWSGMNIVEQRDAAGTTVTKRFLPEGVQFPTGLAPNTKLYYSKDHLGSIRSLTNENGTIVGTIDYDAYGGISRAPVPANDISGAGPVLTSAVSRLTHDFAGIFDVTLPLTGSPGVEMRNGGGNYTVVLTFDRNVLSDTSTTLAGGVGSVSSATFSRNTAIIQLSGVTDRQTITIELDNVVGIVGVNSKVLVSMSVCIGDVNQTSAVTVEDIRSTQSHSGQTATSSNFIYDLNHDGYIDSADIAQDKFLAGDSLYPDFAFTGHYYHARSGLYLAPYRVYNPTIGRWLSRDPIGEGGGTNLYEYGKSDSVSVIDPMGTDIIVLFASHAVSVLGLPQGHIATLIGNNESGWYYYSRNGYDRWPWLFGAGDFSKDYFKTFEQFRNSDYAAQYDQAYHITTGADRDVPMIEYADEHYSERYHSITPPSNNCADLTEEILDAGRLPVAGDNQYPLYNPFGYLDPFNPGYIGSPEVPKFLFPNILRTGAGRLWQVPP